MIPWHCKKEVNKCRPLRGSITKYRKENGVSNHFVEMFLCFSPRLLRDTYFADTEDHAEHICAVKDFTIGNVKKSLITCHRQKCVNSSKIHGQRHVCISSHPPPVYCSSQGSLPLPLVCHYVQFIQHGITSAHFLSVHHLSLLDENKAK